MIFHAALPSYRRKSLAKCAPRKLIPTLTISHWKLMNWPYDYDLAFVKLTFGRKDMLIVSIHIFWFIWQLYSKDFFKNQITILYISCLNLFNFFTLSNVCWIWRCSSPLICGGKKKINQRFLRHPLLSEKTLKKSPNLEKEDGFIL